MMGLVNHDHRLETELYALLTDRLQQLCRTSPARVRSSRIQKTANRDQKIVVTQIGVPQQGPGYFGRQTVNDVPEQHGFAATSRAGKQTDTIGAHQRPLQSLAQALTRRPRKEKTFIWGQPKRIFAKPKMRSI
jgi:hypothetical protein